MLQKESVHRRLESEDGISYTEFSYLLLQARDFLELFDRYGCTLQMGGSDQWGNITAGIELIRKLRAKKAHGLVTPLVTTASGAKFGKTEAGTIWLDPARTRQSEFRNFWLNTDDGDVIAYLKYFTFLTRAEIDDLDALTKGEPEKREAQRVLAASVTTLVHGAEDAGAGGVGERGAVWRESDEWLGRGCGACRGQPAGDCRRCAVDVDGRRAISTATAWASSTSWRGSAGGVEERSASSGAAGRRVGERSKNFGCERAIGARRRARWACLPAAQRLAAAVRDSAHLTYASRYEILSERSPVGNLPGFTHSSS